MSSLALAPKVDKDQQTVAANFRQEAERFERGREARRVRREYESGYRKRLADQPARRHHVEQLRRGVWAYIKRLENRLAALEARLGGAA